MEEMATLWIWLGFTLFLVVMLSIDALLLQNKFARAHESIRAAAIWSVFWVLLALLFCGLLWYYLNQTATIQIANQKSLEFLTGYLIEKSLSLDNLFVFYLIFQQFHIPLRFQQRVLTQGIWSAAILRLIFIFLGVWLIAEFHWLLYVMGLFLLLTGIKMCFTDHNDKDLSQTRFFKLINRLINVTPTLHGNRFFIKKESILYATPLFVALLFVELSDIIFATDSIPAIFAITTDPFIIWTSNIFAILGLRAMYFLIAGMAQQFDLLKFGIAFILIFVGLKMLIKPWVEVSTFFSLGVIATILLCFILLSMKRRLS